MTDLSQVIEERLSKKIQALIVNSWINSNEEEAVHKDVTITVHFLYHKDYTQI